MSVMIQTLARSIREYKKHSILTPLFVALEVVMEIIIPLLMADLIDYGIDGGDMSVVVKVGAALLITALMQLLFGALSGQSSAIASSGLAANLRHDMYHKVQEFSFSTIDKFSTASIVTRITTDVNNVQQAYQMILRLAFRGPLMMVFALFVSYRINAGLALIPLLSIPILGIAFLFIMKKVHPIFARVFKTYDRLNNVVQENLRGIRVVKSFCREEHEIGKFKHISGDIYNDFCRAEKLVSSTMPLMQFCMYGCMLLVSWFGARLIISSGNDPSLGLSTGQLMSLISYSMQILVSLMLLSMVFVMITISRASAERIAELLNETNDLCEPVDPVFSVKNGDICFEHANFSYSGKADRLCLMDIDLSISSGETVGILGATGSSKSSLAQLIPRLYDLTSGRVTVGGVDVRDYDITTLRNSVAMVLQKNVLFSGTIRENLRWGNEHASDEELEQACVLAQADEFIRSFPQGYDTYIEQGGSNVSGGQKQRLCIARALLKKPIILILDDSTSAVDTRTDAQIRRALREHLPGTTKVIIAQRVASVQDADRIIVMDAGRILATGTHEQLLKDSDIYREVYESQIQGGDERE